MTTSAPTQEQVDRIAAEFAPDVVRIFCAFRPDSFGDPAVYMRVVLSDDAAQQRLSDLSRAVRSRLADELELYNSGLVPHFRFRSASEQEQLGDQAWR